jgi:hypothetical protein
MDWLMYITKPENVSIQANERAKIPLVKGCVPVPELGPFVKPFDRAVAYQSWGMLSASALERERGLLAEYMPGPMSDDELLSKAQEIWEDEVRKALENNPDWKI